MLLSDFWPRSMFNLLFLLLTRAELRWAWKRLLRNSCNYYWIHVFKEPPYTLNLPPIFIVHKLCAKYCARSGVCQLFLKGADRKQCRLHRSYGLCLNYSTLSVRQSSRRPCKTKSVTLFPRINIQTVGFNVPTSVLGVGATEWIWHHLCVWGIYSVAKETES